VADKPNPQKRRREVERIEDWDDARYSHVPPRAATDTRLTLVHHRLLVLIGKVNTQHGWCQLSQKNTAETFGMLRQTVCSAIAELVDWGYVEMRTQEQTKTSFCHYRVLIDLPDQGGVSATDDTPPDEGVSPTDDTGVGPQATRVSAPGRHSPMYKDRAREIRDQRSLPPKSPSGGPSANPVDEQWKTAALDTLRASGRYRDAVDGLLVPLLTSDKRLALGKGAERAEALAELAAAAHGLPKPALDTAAKRLIEDPHKLTTAKIRAAIDTARSAGAMFVIRPNMPQWSRWLEHYDVTKPQLAKIIRKDGTSWQVPSEWPPARAQSERASGTTGGAA